MPYTCTLCGPNPAFQYPAHIHTTGPNEWTCCQCLGHGYGGDGKCIRFEEQRERANLKTGYFQDFLSKQIGKE